MLYKLSASAGVKRTSKKPKTEPVKPKTNHTKNIAILGGVSILTKIAICLITILVFHSVIDMFDLQFHMDHVTYLLNGQIPYINFNFDYPVLIFVPYLVSAIPMVLLQSGNAFFLTFVAFMTACDIGITVCIYFIGLKLWNNEWAAMMAGFLYASAFSVAYFIVTRYDAFPTFLLMLAIALTIYRENVKGYSAVIIGFFTKIFPAIALPFLLLYNAKTTSIKKEIISTAIIGIPIVAVLFLPFLALNPANTIHTYLIATGESISIYVNSATYTIFSLLFHTIDLNVISTLMTAGMVISFIALVYIAYKQPVQEEKLLKLILCAIFALIFFTKFHSPQYIVWLTPFFALLAVGDITKLVAFYVIQGLAYIEFPLMFGSVYINTSYTSTAVGSPGWVVAVAFFAIEYTALIIYMAMLVKPKELVTT